MRVLLDRRLNVFVEFDIVPKAVRRRPAAGSFTRIYGTHYAVMLIDRPEDSVGFARCGFAGPNNLPACSRVDTRRLSDGSRGSQCATSCCLS